MADLVKHEPAALSQPEARSLRKLQHFAIPESTRRTYASAWKLFAEWCEGKNVSALPADASTLVSYIAHCESEGYRYNSVGVALAAIHMAHGRRHVPSARNDFDVKEALRALARSQADQLPEKKAPLTVDLVSKLIAALPDSVIGVRDRAILLLGVTSACRRSNLAALTVEDITENDLGLVVRVRRSKTDQTGKGKDIQVHAQSNIALCPVRAYRLWRSLSGVKSGPVFLEVFSNGRIGTESLRGKAIRDVVKRACVRAGLDPAPFGAHSLRAGFATSAADNGKTIHSIMETTGHRDVNTAMGYIRHREVRQQTAGAGLFDSLGHSGALMGGVPAREK